MHPMDIKRLFEKSLKDYVLYDIIKERERAIAIYMLSDDSLKEELDNISMELQNKRIEVNVESIDYEITQRKTRRIRIILAWLGTVPSDHETWFDRFY